MVVTGKAFDQPVGAENASTVAAQLIRDAILFGRLEPGERLMEEDLARELKISRTPIREALLRLQAEGLVEASRNRSATVRSYSESAIEELYMLRALLEGEAAHAAASHGTPELLAVLVDAIKRSDQLDPKTDLEDLLRQNVRFHDAIIGAAGNELLAGLIRQTRVLPLEYQAVTWSGGKAVRGSQRWHRKIVAALRAGDADAARTAMHDHVFAAHDIIVAHRGRHADPADGR